MKHFLDTYPNEGVGYLDSKGEFHPLENLSSDPHAFALAPDTFIKHDIQVLLHSHCVKDLADLSIAPDGTEYESGDARCPSKTDLEQQLATAVEWGIVVTDGKDCLFTPTWGNPATRPGLEGREYIGNLNDCFTLVQDYMHQKGIEIENLPRDVWFEDALIDENFHKYGYRKIALRELEPDDLIAYAVRTSTPRHLGIYLGRNKVLSHWNQRLSAAEDFGRFSRYAVYGLRREKN